MHLLKPTPEDWQPGQYRYAAIDAAKIDPQLLHVLQTTALVESRADLYADYLREVFAGQDESWLRAVDRWNVEERRHGVALRRVSEAVDRDFRFDDAMRDYLSGVHYHDGSDGSVRGSVAGELIARCVVEALASTFYRALADATADATCREILQQLGRDEARHYGMFAAMMRHDATLGHAPSLWRRLRVGIGRMLELGDRQIIYASHVAGRRPHGFRGALEAQRYARALYGRYRWPHLRYAARLLAPVLFARRSSALEGGLACALWLGVKVKWLCAVLACAAVPDGRGAAAAHDAWAKADL